MTGKTHIAISAASVTLYLLVSGVRVSRCPLYSQAPFRNEHSMVLPGTGCTDLYGVTALFVLGLAAGLFPDLDVEGSSIERLPARAAAYLERRSAFRLTRQRPIHKGAGRSRRRGQTHSHSRDASIVDLVLAILLVPVLLASQILRLAGIALRVMTTHRGFTHTLTGAALFAAAILVAASLITLGPYSTLATGAWLTGYASHLASDACTPGGIPLFRVPFARHFARLFARLFALGPEMPSAPWGRSASKDRHRFWPPFYASLTGSSLFHLLPNRMRVLTGSYIDTAILRWGGWIACGVMVLLLATP